ncbi:hypothetical protein RMSM_00745 [Rhodopirellula maiorica SM1]|uniref:Uncharacterized protein n=1 Tax=Rhodopirellula maiorica SM1 TaxID=1265738 RepID=M5S840_9BACT|nr:hypothetical protein RMSM_00745 [Rhodopirellula maiorica SM1]
MICVTLLCVFLGRIATTAKRQRDAKQELERLGVSVMYEHEWHYSGKQRSLTSRLLEPVARHVDPNFDFR